MIITEQIDDYILGTVRLQFEHVAHLFMNFSDPCNLIAISVSGCYSSFSSSRLMFRNIYRLMHILPLHSVDILFSLFPIF
jgi:hypothetical protein